MDYRFYIIIALCCFLPFLISFMHYLHYLSNTDRTYVSRSLTVLSFRLSLFIVLYILIALVIGQALLLIVGVDITNLQSLENRRILTIITTDLTKSDWSLFIAALVALTIVFTIVIKHMIFLVEIVLIEAKISIYSRLHTYDEYINFATEECNQLIEKLRRHNLPDLFKNSLKDIYEQ